MKLTAVKTFRPQNAKGVTVHPGESIEVDGPYGEELVRNGMAVEAKMHKEYENKMRDDFANKHGAPAASADERSQGTGGPTKDSETPEQRNQGKNNAKPEKK